MGFSLLFEDKGFQRSQFQKSRKLEDSKNIYRQKGSFEEKISLSIR
jgi:hypothetical protein